MGLLTNSIILISQYTHVSIHHIIHLKLTQCSMSIISQWIWKKNKEYWYAPLVSVWWKPWRIDRTLSFVPFLLQPHKCRRS